MLSYGSLDCILCQELVIEMHVAPWPITSKSELPAVAGTCWCVRLAESIFTDIYTNISSFMFAGQDAVPQQTSPKRLRSSVQPAAPAQPYAGRYAADVDAMVAHAQGRGDGGAFCFIPSQPPTFQPQPQPLLLNYGQSCLPYQLMSQPFAGGNPAAAAAGNYGGFGGYGSNVLMPQPALQGFSYVGGTSSMAPGSPAPQSAAGRRPGGKRSSSDEDTARDPTWSPAASSSEAKEDEADGDDAYEPEMEHAAASKPRAASRKAKISAGGGGGGVGRSKVGGSSRFRGVTRHSTTGRYEAHLWDAAAVRPKVVSEIPFVPSCFCSFLLHSCPQSGQHLIVSLLELHLLWQHKLQTTAPNVQSCAVALPGLVREPSRMCAHCAALDRGSAETWSWWRGHF